MGTELGAGRLAQRIHRLVEARRGRGDKPLTNFEIAEGMTAAGYPASETLIFYLRKGQRDNPTMKVLEGLAAFFSVPVSYFFDDDVAVEQIDSELEMLMAMRDSDVRSIAMRARELTPEARRWLAESLGNFPTGATRDGDPPATS